MGVAGVLLAAGAGRRMGAPKALMRDAVGVPWVTNAARTLVAAGCAPVIVVAGAEADAVRDALSHEPVELIVAADWSDGMSASLRAGLRAAATTDADAALIHLVDLPDVDARVVRRLHAHATREALARAGYRRGSHGHPVLIGRAHWAGVCAGAVGDAGARAYLADHVVVIVDCSDLADGTDIDEPADLPVGSSLPRLRA